MKKRNLLRKKTEIFYNDILMKRDMNETMMLQTDLEFQQNEIKILNAKYIVDMFSTRLRVGKAFAAEKNIRELKKLLLKRKIIEKRKKNKINSNTLIKKAANNLNNTTKSIKNEEFKEVYDFHRLNKVKEDLKRRER